MPKPQILLECADQHFLGGYQLKEQLGKVSAPVFQGGVHFWDLKIPRYPEFSVILMIKPGDPIMQRFVDVMVEPTATPSAIYKTCLSILKVELKTHVNEVNSTLDNIERAQTSD